MTKTGLLSICFLLMLGAAVPAYSYNFVWFTDDEMGPFGEYVPFRTGDSLYGRVHSNSSIRCEGSPVFYGEVSTGGTFIGGNPYFYYPPVENAPQYALPEVSSIRSCAAASGNYYVFPGQNVRIRCHGSAATAWRWERGTPLDSNEAISWQISFSGPTCIFVDGSLQLYGEVQGKVTFGASGTVYLMDNLRYVDANPYNGDVSEYSPNLIGVLSEGNIKIANTIANGRGNSGGLGPDQPNRALTDIALTGIYYAEDSFTFEQQNDPDSGYVCAYLPDYRGHLYLSGSLTQGQRGYLYRANNGGTGYNMILRFDPRLFYYTPPGFYGLYTPFWSDLSTDTLDFGEVVMQTTAWDTARVCTDHQVSMSYAYATWPFYSPGAIPPYGESFEIPVRFTPPGIGHYTGTLTLRVWPWEKVIILLGEGVEPEEGAPGSVAVESEEEK